MNKLTFSLRLNLSLSGFRDKFFIISNNNVVYTYFCCNVSMCNIRVSSEKEKSFYENFAFFRETFVRWKPHAWLPIFKKKFTQTQIFSLLLLWSPSKILGLGNYSFRQTISTVKITKRHLMLKNANSLVLSNQDLLKAWKLSKSIWNTMIRFIQ